MVARICNMVHEHIQQDVRIYWNSCILSSTLLTSYHTTRKVYVVTPLILRSFGFLNTRTF